MDSRDTRRPDGRRKVPSQSSMDDLAEVRRLELAEERNRVLLRELNAREAEIAKLQERVPDMPSLPPKQKAQLYWVAVKLREQAVAIILSLLFGVAAALRPTATPQKVENQGVTLTAATTELEDARKRVLKLEECRKQLTDWAAAQQAYDLEVWSKAGIEIRHRDDAPTTRPVLETTAAVRAGKITSAPVLHVNTPPPAPPNCQ